LELVIEPVEGGSLSELQIGWREPLHRALTSIGCTDVQLGSCHGFLVRLNLSIVFQYFSCGRCDSSSAPKKKVAVKASLLITNLGAGDERKITEKLGLEFGRLEIPKHGQRG
jgi:hypothetical protein